MLVLAAGASDFVFGSFWERHALLTSLLASILVLVVTVIVVNEVIDRRDQRRWNLLAQSVLFALIQAARATWTGMVEVLEVTEVQGGSVEWLLRAPRSRVTPHESREPRMSCSPTKSGARSCRG